MTTDKIYVDIVEKELVRVDFVEKELIEVVFNQVDRIGAFTKLQVALLDILIYNELPTRLSSTTFRTANEYVSGTLRVYFNGLRESNVTELNNTSFKIADTESTDDIVIDYIKDCD